MEISINPASLAESETIQNLGRFYVYDMSRYCGFLKGWETPKNGLFECNDLSRYWKEPNRYPFLIRADNEIAGFVLINKVGSTSEVDWNMGEFFIISKYQGKGVGSYVSEHIFKKFSGIWEVMQIPENQGAIAFWQKVINRYTKGKFQKSRKIIAEPIPHPMLVLKFDSASQNLERQSFMDFKIFYQETASAEEEEAILLEGITEEALKRKQTNPIKSFAFFIKDFNSKILGGLKGASYYGCLYIDSLWVTSTLRNQGWGSRLMQKAEELGKQRNCSFASLTTMDWEALPFYLKHGYEIEYTREGFENNSKMFFLRKSL